MPSRHEEELSVPEVEDLLARLDAAEDLLRMIHSKVAPFAVYHLPMEAVNDAIQDYFEAHA